MSRKESQNYTDDAGNAGGGGNGSPGAERDCTEVTFTTSERGELCISYEGVEEGEEYEIIIQGRGCRSVLQCRVIDGRWQCSRR